MIDSAIAVNQVSLAALPTPMTRAYLESAMPAVLHHLGEDVCRTHLLTLAKAPGELFHATPEATQVMRVDEALTAYAGQSERGAAASVDVSTTYLDIVRVDPDLVILGVVDLYDGTTVIAALPTDTAAQFALTLLKRIQDVVGIGDNRDAQ
jgi:hypothetical protein